MKSYLLVELVPPEKKLVDGAWSRSKEMVAATVGSRLSGAGPAPPVVSVRPAVPEPAPPEPPVVPPGPPPVVKMDAEPPSVFAIRPEGAPRGDCPVLVRRISVSAMLEIVAGDGDVVVVLKGQRDGVGEAEIDFAVLHHVIEAHRVGKACLGDGCRQVYAERIAAESRRRAWKNRAPKSRSENGSVGTGAGTDGSSEAALSGPFVPAGVCAAKPEGMQDAMSASLPRLRAAFRQPACVVDLSRLFTEFPARSFPAHRTHEYGANAWFLSTNS